MTKIYSRLGWKEYEDLVCEAMERHHPDLTFERNIKLYGNNSEIERQIDIAAKGKLAGHDIFVVIDCKKYSTKLDINDVGSFISFLNDVGADIGILVTQKGYSKSAQILAKKSRVKLEIKTLEELEKYKITLDFCKECDSGDDHFSGVVEWQHPESFPGDYKKIASAGYCNKCRTLHIRCLNCNTITGIPDVMYENAVECLGGCGTFFTITTKHIGHGMLDLILKVEQTDVE